VERTRVLGANKPPRLLFTLDLSSFYEKWNFGALIRYLFDNPARDIYHAGIQITCVERLEDASAFSFSFVSLRTRASSSVFGRAVRNQTIDPIAGIQEARLTAIRFSSRKLESVNFLCNDERGERSSLSLSLSLSLSFS